MAELIRRTLITYNLIFYEYPDPRTREWFLAAKPLQGLLILGIYLMFVFKWGPRWMKHRPAFNVRRALIAYNALQIVMCAFLFIKSLKVWGWGGSYKWICEPVDYSNTEGAMDVAKLVYLYYVLKIIDLFDTVFFVLRKKFNQASFLHVYHHAGMVILIWAAVTYYPGGHGSFVGVVNSFVHTIMYTYYLLSVIFPSIRNAIWAKKLVTISQIIQFFIFVVHMSVIVLIPNCKYPRWISAVFLPQNLFMLILFIDFYIKTYVRKSEKRKPKETVLIINDNDTNGTHIINNELNKTNYDNGTMEHLIWNHHGRDNLVARNKDRIP